MSDGLPERIVCLTEESVEVLYALGEQDRIVGVSQFAVRPPEARDKPKISTFISARMERIMDLEPDLAIGFSDIQADIARDLVKAGVEVWFANHRTISGILGYIRRLGAMVGRSSDADDWAHDIARHIEDVRADATDLDRRPRVYFEEWDDPMITAIRWVSEVIEVAGGDDVFADVSRASLATGRIVDPDEVVRRDPEILMASWCGKMYAPDSVFVRPGWDALEPVRTETTHEIPAEIILQPGPAALTDGLDHLHGIIREWATAC